MEYKELRKLYYGDVALYRETYAQRYSSEESIKTGLTIAGNPAFFCATGEVYKLAYQIEKLNNKVCLQCASLPGVALEQYSKKCLIDEIVLTNKIEGVHSSRKEIGDVLSELEEQTEERKKQPRFLGLVKKYAKLMEGEPVPLSTCQDIRDIYDEIVLDEVVRDDPANRPDGKLFRKESTSVYNAADKIIHTGLTPESRIIEAMEQALHFLGDDSVDKLFRICIFHYLIEYIHPFYDGNGRLGRFILSYCVSETLAPLLAYRISETIQENIQAYYHAFETCNDPHELGDLTPFLLMQLQMILLSLQELNDSLDRRLETWKKYEDLTQKLIKFEEGSMVHALYSCLIQAALFSENGISTRELEKNLQQSYYCVRKLLSAVPPELLVVSQKGKQKYYEIDRGYLDETMLKGTAP